MDRWHKLWEYADDEGVTITPHDTPDVVTFTYASGETATLQWDYATDEWNGREYTRSLAE